MTADRRLVPVAERQAAKVDVHLRSRGEIPISVENFGRMDSSRCRGQDGSAEHVIDGVIRVETTPKPRRRETIVIIGTEMG